MVSPTNNKTHSTHLKQARNDDAEIDPMDLPAGTRVWLYVRHSPGENQTCEAQLAELMRIVEEKGWIVDKLFKDQWTSGSTVENREDFARMLYLGRGGPRSAKLILIVDMSRFSRNPTEAQLFRSQLRWDGWKILSLQDYIPAGPTAPIFEAMVDWKNQQFLRDLKKKTISGLQYIVEQGCLPGGKVVKGYVLKEKEIGYYRDGTIRVGRKPEPDRDMQSLIVKAFELKARGMPYNLIAKETWLYGPKATGAWNHMFSDRVYLGEYEFQGQIYKNVYPALISAELFEAVQKQLPQRPSKQWKLKGLPKHAHPRRKGSRFFLANISVCQHCGADMEGKSDERGRFYICSRRNEQTELCPEANLIEADSVEREILRILKDHVLDQEYLQDLLDWTNHTLSGGLEELQLQLDKVEKELSAAETLAYQMGRNLLLKIQERSWALEGPVHDQEKKVEQLKIQMAALEAEISRRRIEVSRHEIEAYLQHAHKMIESAVSFDLREVVEQLCSRIIMNAEECVVELHFPNI